MKELRIEKNIDNKKNVITLTDGELEKAYQIMKQRYLEEDFANTLANNAQDSSIRFHSGHLEEFPELSDWLCQYFNDIYDAGTGHNDLIELALNHLHDASLKPEFFLSLSQMAPAVCMGIEKDRADCEQSCGRYHHCSNIAEANDRSRQWETLASLFTMHHNGDCACNKSGGRECSIAKYLKGEWDISRLFHSEDRKEAV